MNENFVKWSANKWSNCTFIFPCVSVGNIGQLAVDLLIASVSDIKKAGQLINNRLVQPIVGYDPYNECSNELSVSIELYESIGLNLVIMQQRAPLFKGKRKDFVKLLVDFIKEQNFKEIICLTSSYAYERVDSQLSGNQCRFLSISKIEMEEFLNQLKWLHLEKRSNKDLQQMEDNRNNNLKPINGVYIPGGGIAEIFYKTCEEEKLDCKVLIIFADDGNNIPEAFIMLNYLNQWKQYLQKINRPNWQIPISWSYLFGRNIDFAVESQLF